MNKDEAINKLIAKASSFIGYKAESGKRNQFAKYLDNITNFYNGKKDGFDWCECFVDAIFTMTFGNPTGRKMIYQPEKSLGAACPYSANYYIKNNAWTKTPKRGYQAFLGKRGDEYHTGIVESVNGNIITLIEGNAGGGVGAVMRRKWNISEFSGFGIPNYSLVTTEDVKPEKPKSKVVTVKDVNDKCDILASKVVDTLRGKNGSGSKVRKEKLGEWYEPVQFIINQCYK